MSSVLSFITSLIPEGFDGVQYLQCIAGVIIGFLIISVIGRLIFGKNSTINRSVSCASAILCIYVVNIVLYSYGVSFLLSPLPFITYSDNQLLLFSFFNAGLPSICSQILSMLFLTLITVILDNFLPRGKKFLIWLSLRIVNIVSAYLIHHVLRLLIDFIIPTGALIYAPVVLVILLFVAMLLGLLKLIIGGALAFLSPVLGILYSFFFENLIGKQIRKSALTTIILCGLVLLLNYLGIGSVIIGTSVLIAYLPILLIALLLWYLITHLL